MQVEILINIDLEFGYFCCPCNVKMKMQLKDILFVNYFRPRIEFSHQTKTVFVGGLEDGIDDAELHRYFSEFGFVTRALRIPNKDGPKRKFGELSIEKSPNAYFVVCSILLPKFVFFNLISGFAYINLVSGAKI